MNPTLMRVAIASTLAAVLGVLLHAQTTTYDLVLRNGRVIDGTGNPWFRADVAIQAGELQVGPQRSVGLGGGRSRAAQGDQLDLAVRPLAPGSTKHAAPFAARG